MKEIKNYVWITSIYSSIVDIILYPMIVINYCYKVLNEERNGKGIIYIFRVSNENPRVNFEGWLNTRFTIAVGSVNQYGLHAQYSSLIASLFIVAPGGDLQFLTNHVVAQPKYINGDAGCLDVSAGTSFAAPVIPGVVSLMLEVNPNLG